MLSQELTYEICCSEAQRIMKYYLKDIDYNNPKKAGDTLLERTKILFKKMNYKPKHMDKHPHADVLFYIFMHYTFCEAEKTRDLFLSSILKLCGIFEFNKFGFLLKNTEAYIYPIWALFFCHFFWGKDNLDESQIDYCFKLIDESQKGWDFINDPIK